ncbi:MAG: solute carrier family 23 protein [Chlorobium sp.]
MNQKPANIIYGVEDVPPLRTALLLAVQQAVLALVFIVYPLMLIAEAHGSENDAEQIVTASILAMAFGTFLQSFGRKGIGSGFLAIQISSPIYLPVSLQAAHAGGLGLVFGMTLFGGVFSVCFARLLKYLRPLFPAEVCGVGVVMLGISMVAPALPRIFAVHDSSSLSLPAFAVAFVTLALMVALSIWPKGNLRLFSAVIGLCCGYGAAFCFGLLDLHTLSGVLERGWVALPILPNPDWSFRLALLPPFLLTALVSSLDSVACVITCQKVNQHEWVRPDMKNVSSGVLADGFSTVFAALFGSLGTCISSAHLALSAATGATSRRIGQLTALLLFLAAFIPPIAKLLSHIPEPVIGAVLLYAAAFLITSGMELIVSRMLDIRRIFMIGCSIIVGLASIQLTEHLKQLPPSLYSILGSPFALASLCAILLNLLFRIGITQSALLRVEPQLTSVGEVITFIERRGAGWGARRQVIQHAQNALTELLEVMISMKLSEGVINVKSSFDEYYLDIIVSYTGKTYTFSGVTPSPDEILDDEHALMRLSGSLIKQYASRVQVDTDKGEQRISFRFEH